MVNDEFSLHTDNIHTVHIILSTKFDKNYIILNYVTIIVLLNTFNRIFVLSLVTLLLTHVRPL